MIVNFNIGLLGHVDSGKTTLARALSGISSTAAFDKNPQSQERGITLDLGFSGLLVKAPSKLKVQMPHIEQMQFTFVDCPGHASLIRTIIGGAQIIDIMILVIDAQKGIQTQTAECIVIGELLRKKLIVVVNKIDLLDESNRNLNLTKLTTKLRKTLSNTYFGADVPIYHVSAQNGTNIEELLAGIRDFNYERCNTVDEANFLMQVDHCFSIKGQGTICTGTIVQGKLSVGDTIELPALGEKRKVKSIQMFRRPVELAFMGDRVGVCVTQFNAKLMERGILATPDYLKPIFAVCVRLNRIQYYKNTIKSKAKMHVTVGHETIMANVTLFSDVTFGDALADFDHCKEYEYVEELTEDTSKCVIFALLEFEKPIWTTSNAIVIASKLDMEAHSSSCRLAFWGSILWLTPNNVYAKEELPRWRIFKRKQKQGTVQRMVNEREVIVQNLFKKVANRDLYIGKTVELSTGEIGYIESTFGQTSKVRICFRDPLKADTIKLLSSQQSAEVQVFLKCKKYIFNKQMALIQ